MAGKLTKLAAGVLMTHYTRSKVSTGLLGDITRAAGGNDELAARVTAANTARHAVELWTDAGLLGPAGTELCRRVAEVLARFCAELTAAAGTSPGLSSPGLSPPGLSPPGLSSPTVPSSSSSSSPPPPPAAAATSDLPALPAPPATPRRPARMAPAVEVIMVDFTGRDMIAAFPGRVA
jgi:hypothetical protein